MRPATPVEKGAFHSSIQGLGVQSLALGAVVATKAAGAPPALIGLMFFSLPNQSGGLLMICPPT